MKREQKLEREQGLEREQKTLEINVNTVDQKNFFLRN